MDHWLHIISMDHWLHIMRPVLGLAFGIRTPTATYTRAHSDGTGGTGAAACFRVRTCHRGSPWNIADTLSVRGPTPLGPSLCWGPAGGQVSGQCLSEQQPRTAPCLPTAAIPLQLSKRRGNPTACRLRFLCPGSSGEQPRLVRPAGCLLCTTHTPHIPSCLSCVRDITFHLLNMFAVEEPSPFAGAGESAAKGLLPGTWPAARTATSIQPRAKAVKPFPAPQQGSVQVGFWIVVSKRGEPRARIHA